jgi:hypothetical protein
MKVTSLSGEDKVERDYRDSEECVEELAKEEIEKIRRKLEALKVETQEVGAAVEAELERREAKEKKKS